MGRAIDSRHRPRAEGGETCLSTWWSVVRFGLCVVVIGLVLSLLVLPWLDLSFWRVFRRCVSVAAALSLWLCIRHFEGRSFRSYGFSVPGAARPQLLFGLLLGLGSLGLMWGISFASGVCRIDVTPERLRLWRTVIGFIPVAILISFLEELVFRGFILQHLLSSSKSIAVIASSALYALVHLKTQTLTLATYLELGGLFLLGGVLALSYLRTHQLYLAVGLHAALAYGARVNKLLIEFPDPSISWLTGTSRLVNGLMSWVALLGMGAVVMWWARPRTRGVGGGARSPYRGGVDHGNA